MAHKTNGDDDVPKAESLTSRGRANDDDVPSSVPFSMNKYRFHLRIGPNEDSPAITVRWIDLSGQDKFQSLKHKAVDEFVKRREQHQNGSTHNNAAPYDNFEVEIKYYFSKPYTAPNWWQIISEELDFLDAICDNQEQQLLQMIATIKSKTKMEKEEAATVVPQATTPPPTPTPTVTRNPSPRSAVDTRLDALIHARKAGRQPHNAPAAIQQATTPPPDPSDAFKPPSPRSVVGMFQDPFFNATAPKGHTTGRENKVSVKDCQNDDLECLDYRENEHGALESIKDASVKTSPLNVVPMPQQRFPNAAAAAAKRPAIDDDDDDVVYVGTKRPTAKKAKVVAETSASASLSNNPKVVGLAEKIMGFIAEFDVLGLTNSRDFITLLVGYQNRNSKTPKEAWLLLSGNNWIQYSDSDTVCVTYLGKSQTMYLSVAMPLSNDEQRNRIRSLLKSLVKSLVSAKKLSTDLAVRLFDHILKDGNELFEQKVVSKVLGYTNPGSAAPKQALKLLTTLGILSSSKAGFYHLNTQVAFPFANLSNAIAEDNHSSVEKWAV